MSEPRFNTPWRLSIVDEYYAAILDRDGTVVAESIRGSEVAHLLEAAPDLREALARLLEEVEWAERGGLVISQGTIDDSNIALAKARGES